MKTAAELVAEVKSRIREITPAQAKTLHAEGKAVFLDVRDREEVNLGKVKGATHISRGTLEGKVEAQIPRDAQVVIYCAGGNRSAYAAETLQAMGYKDVVSVIDGWRGWTQVGGEVEG